MIQLTNSLGKEKWTPSRILCLPYLSKFPSKKRDVINNNGLKQKPHWTINLHKPKGSNQHYWTSSPIISRNDRDNHSTTQCWQKKEKNSSKQQTIQKLFRYWTSHPKKINLYVENVPTSRHFKPSPVIPAIVAKTKSTHIMANTKVNYSLLQPQCPSFWCNTTKHSNVFILELR